MSDLNLDFADSDTPVLYLEVPAAKVILFQAIFEMYEGVAIVRTVDVKRSLVCVLSTPSMVEECRNVLDSIQDEIGWKFAEQPSAEDRARYLGVFGKPN